MFSILTKYKKKDHFSFKTTDSLASVCNAPFDKSGVYLVYGLKNQKMELIYIGRSGELKEDGSMFIRKAGLGGMKDRIVNGHQFGKIARKRSWPEQMLKETIEALVVYWYVTHDKTYIDCPLLIESKLLEEYRTIYSQLPEWNKRG